MQAAGFILAGGKSRRFGEMPKALAKIDGMTLIEHVIERLSPQVGALAIGVEKRNPLFNTFSLEQIEDPAPGNRGPLPSLLAGLRWLDERGSAEWLQLAPCDTPFLPTDLVGRLALHVKSQQAEVVVPNFRGQIHAACGLWNLSMIPTVEQAVGDGLQGFMQLFDIYPPAVLDWPEPHAGASDPFFNINTPAQLEAARRET